MTLTNSYSQAFSYFDNYEKDDVHIMDAISCYEDYLPKFEQLPIKSFILCIPGLR